MSWAALREMWDAFADAWREIRGAVAWLIADALAPRPSADALLDGILHRLEASTASLTATQGFRAPERSSTPDRELSGPARVPRCEPGVAQPLGKRPLAGPSVWDHDPRPWGGRVTSGTQGGVASRLSKNLSRTPAARLRSAISCPPNR
jgi:hypothetical protein